MGRGRRQGRGFGTGGHVLADASGARGPEKRWFLNQVSGVMVLAGGAAGGYLGSTVAGLPGAVIGFVLLAAAVARLVAGGRYLR